MSVSKSNQDSIIFCAHGLVEGAVFKWYDAGMSVRLISIFSLTLLLLPLGALAQERGLVPCNGPDCNWASLLQLGKNILNFIITIAIIAAGIMFAYAGFKYFTAGGNSSKVGEAHKIFFHVVVGLVVILTAWLVVNTILETLTGRGLDQRAGEVSLLDVDIPTSIV